MIIDISRMSADQDYAREMNIEESNAFARNPDPFVHLMGVAARAGCIGFARDMLVEHRPFMGGQYPAHAGIGLTDLSIAWVLSTGVEVLAILKQSNG